VAIFAQQRIHPVFLPRLRNNGGASLTSRRHFSHKILDAALLVLPALHSGDNFRNCQLTLSLSGFALNLLPFSNR
jgi:hypothetical protein